jgi:hypothetical protein
MLLYFNKYLVGQKKKIKLVFKTKKMNRNNEIKLWKGNVEIYNSTKLSHNDYKKIKKDQLDRENEGVSKLKSFFEGNRLPYKIHPGSFCP